MKIAILGISGCFAQSLARTIPAEIELLGIGRSPPKASAFWNVPARMRYEQLDIVRQLPALMSLLDNERLAVVVQYAAQGEGAASFGDNAPDFFETNTTALVRLVCELRKRAYLKRFVHIGSSEVYGSPDAAAEEDDLLMPGSPYAVSKAAFDQYLEIMWRTAQFPAYIIRPSNCYVPGQQLHRIIPHAIICALRGRKIALHGGGRAEKSYLHADDLSRAIVTVIERGAPGGIWNVGPDECIAIRTLVGLVADALGVEFDALVQDAPDRTGQDARYWLDCTRIKNLGWRPAIALEAGIEQMIAWVRAHPELLTMDATFRHRP